MRVEGDITRTLGVFRRGGIDPSMRVWPGECWRASLTPYGPATLHLRQRTADVEAEAWGPGASWALARVPALLGLEDDDDGFDPRLPLLHEAVRRVGRVRIGRTERVAEAMAPTIIEQKVTSGGAHRSWATIVRRYGEPAPGPMRLVVPPSPDVLASIPSWVFHRADVERKRADALTGAMARASRLEETVSMPMSDAYARFQALPGVGVWTAAEVAHVALGDPDAVSVGDYHLKHVVSYALTGERRGTDERMLELLEPWRGHRARVIRLIGASHRRPPRRGPRMAHLAIAGL